MSIKERVERLNSEFAGVTFDDKFIVGPNNVATLGFEIPLDLFSKEELAGIEFHAKIRITVAER